jgi:hypothetical protein
VPADDLVQQGGVEHRAGARARLVERGRERHEAVARDPAVGRLGPDGAGDGCRLADRAAGVGADGQRRLEEATTAARATAGAAGDALEVPRVVARAVGAVLGRGAHGELVHVRLAEDGHAGRAQARRPRSRRTAAPSPEDLGAAGRRQAAGGQDVLDGDRAPPPARAATRPRPRAVDLVGLGEGAVRVDVQVGVHGAVDGRGAVEVRLGHLARRHAPLREEVGEVGSSGPGQVGGHVVVPLGCGARW